MSFIAIASTIGVALICLMEITATGEGRHKR